MENILVIKQVWRCLFLFVLVSAFFVAADAAAINTTYRDPMLFLAASQGETQIDLLNVYPSMQPVSSLFSNRVQFPAPRPICFYGNWTAYSCSNPGIFSGGALAPTPTYECKPLILVFASPVFGVGANVFDDQDIHGTSLIISLEVYTASDDTFVVQEDVATCGDQGFLGATSTDGIVRAIFRPRPSNQNPIGNNMEVERIIVQFGAPLNVMVQSEPEGMSLAVDGIEYTAPQQFTWWSGTQHTLSAVSPQGEAEGRRYVWSNWSDSGEQTHVVSPTINETFIAYFLTEYYLTMSAGTGGSANPSSGWHMADSAVEISAIPDAGHRFTRWIGSGIGAYDGTSALANVTISGPIAEDAVFDPTVDVRAPNMPTCFALGASAPNPFNPATTLTFDLPQAERVRLAIFDLSGRRLRVLVDEVRAAGSHKVQWNGMNERGQKMASGVYVYRMEAGAFRETRRMTLAK